MVMSKTGEQPLFIHPNRDCRARRINRSGLRDRYRGHAEHYHEGQFFEHSYLPDAIMPSRLEARY